MKFISILALVLFVVCDVAKAQQVPVVGSCTASSLGKNWSQCDFTAMADPRSKVHGDVLTCALSCYDFADYKSNENCEYPPKVAQCELVNPHYAGVCHENVEYFGETTPEAACNGIVDYLNNVTSAAQDGCLKNYCMSTSIRRNWSLKVQ